MERMDHEAAAGGRLELAIETLRLGTVIRNSHYVAGTSAGTKKEFGRDLVLRGGIPSAGQDATRGRRRLGGRNPAA